MEKTFFAKRKQLFALYFKQNRRAGPFLYVHVNF